MPQTQHANAWLIETGLITHIEFIYNKYKISWDIVYLRYCMYNTPLFSGGYDLGAASLCVRGAFAPFA